MRVNKSELYGVKSSTIVKKPFRVDTSSPETPEIVETTAEEEGGAQE